MSSLLLYLGVLALGVLVGSRKVVRAAKCRWIGPVQSAALVVLIFTLDVDQLFLLEQGHRLAHGGVADGIDLGQLHFGGQKAPPQVFAAEDGLL